MSLCNLITWTGILSMLVLFSCKSDKPTDANMQPIVIKSGYSNVLVVNEGNFQFDNASLSFQNSVDNSTTEDVYKAANSQGLGDVAQSAVVSNGKVYVVVNNSQKIEILDAKTFRSLGSVGGLKSPRYIQLLGNAKAYVSDLYDNAISVVDINARTVTKKIPCNGWTERMIYHLGKVYVTNYWQPYLYVIDPFADVLADSIYIGTGAQSIVSDKFDRLVVACGGYKIAQTESKIVFVNPYTKSVEKKVSFAVNNPTQLLINQTKDSLYYLNTHVYKMAISDVNEPVNLFISGANRNFYGLGLDQKNNQLFVSDAVDYVQRGTVYVYSGTKQLSQFKAGINPNGFCFY
jgi:YVTN family beta-propeller protein